MLRSPESEMTRFNWSPGIGDPTVAGWLTVILYVVTSVSCWILARDFGSVGIERGAWRSISVLFLFLGINKQLDLQTALTEAGRYLAHYQGWYEQRQLVQLAFVALIAVMCLISAITLLIWVRDAPISTWLALIGTTLVIGYVLVRAASFHHVDRFIGRTILGFRWNWILEMGGIALVLLASQARPILWPWVDPTTGATYTLPAKARYDAGTPYTVAPTVAHGIDRSAQE